jgi:hypothetical protein
VKRIFLFLSLCLLISPLITIFAEPKVYITEASYQMKETDTLAVAEETCLLKAKYTAVLTAFKEANYNIDNLNLALTQISSFPEAAIKSTVLDQKREIDGNSMNFWVKIKSEISIEKLIDTVNTLKNNSQSMVSIQKPVICGVIIFNSKTPEKLSRNMSKFDFNEFVNNPNFISQIKQAMSDKYNTRSSVLETGAQINEQFTNMVLKDKPQSEWEQFDQESINEFANNNQYDYVLTVFIHVNECIFKPILLPSGAHWTMEFESDIKLFSVSDNKYIYNSAFNDRFDKKFNYGGPFGIEMGGTIKAVQDQAMIELGNKIASHINAKDLPGIPLQ